MLEFLDFYRCGYVYKAGGTMVKLWSKSWLNLSFSYIFFGFIHGCYFGTWHLILPVRNEYLIKLLRMIF